MKLINFSRKLRTYNKIMNQNHLMILKISRKIRNNMRDKKIIFVLLIKTVMLHQFHALQVKKYLYLKLKMNL